MSDPKIDRDIPVPAKDGGGSGPRWHDLIMKMRNGDSVLIEGAEEIRRFRSAVRYAQRTKGVKMISRSREGGVRFWRIE